MLRRNYSFVETLTYATMDTMHESPDSSDLSYRERLCIDAAFFAEQQEFVGEQWAILYANLKIEPDTSAAIVLHNPAAYLRELHRLKLPAETLKRWTDLNDTCDVVAQTSSTEPVEWETNVTGIDKLQFLVKSGYINPQHRGAVAEIMRRSSKLLADAVRPPHSLSDLPGYIPHYAGNLTGAVSALYDPEQRYIQRW